MTPAERRLLEALERRALHLARFASTALRTNTYLPAVVSFSAALVIRTCFALCGEAIRSEILRWMLNSLREQHGICICGELKARFDDALCATCEAQCAADDREIDQLEAMEKPAKGPVS